MSEMCSELEMLTSDLLVGNEVEQQLSDYYQKLTRERTWRSHIQNMELLAGSSEAYYDLGGTSPTLSRALRTQEQANIDRQWSYVGTGAAPNLERMASRQPPYPQSRAGKHKRSVFFCVPFGGRSDKASDPFKKIATEFFSTRLENVDSTLLETAYTSFFSWLIHQDSNREWRTLCSDATGIEDGCYPSPRLLGTPAPVYHFFYKRFPSNHILGKGLNPERIRKAFNEPDAVVLTEDFLVTCFREYLETLNLDKLIQTTKKNGD